VKDSAADLAIFGAPPAFAEKVHVGRPNVPDREKFMARVADLLDRKWLTNRGPYVEEFERRVADLVGVRNCIAMCNGTMALEIAIRATGLQGEVILPSFTFISTAHALQWQKITPVFCDVDPLTHGIDPSRIEALITPKTTGIIGVHIWGRPCEIEALEDIGRRRKLVVLFDAAHAFGCSYKGRMLGNYGAAEVFSFHATKVVNTFEGGAVVTNDDSLAERVRLMKNFGFVDYDRVEHVGTNGKMSEISAAMGLTSIECLERFRSVNCRNYGIYRDQLNAVPGIRLLGYDESEKCHFHYVVVEVEEADAGINRDQLQQVLWAENVLARRYFYPGCHRSEPYHSYFPHTGLLLPQTERLVTRILCLPTGETIGSEDIAEICRIIRLALNNADLIRSRTQASTVAVSDFDPR
jgi:dTDP-4-amino-4,6-dideoxygalactose transaminase